MRRLIVLAAFICLLAPGIASAKDANGCDGLGDYRAAMLKSITAHNEGLAKDGIPIERPPMTYSSDDWTALAKRTLTLQRALKKITPPAFAADWHQTQIEWAGLIEQGATASAKDGIGAFLAFGPALDANAAAKASALETAIAACGDFAAFQSAYANPFATPVATPA